MPYEEHCPERACYECAHSRYDNGLDETYCTHTPLPDRIQPRAIVNSCGTCEFWESFDGGTELLEPAECNDKAKARILRELVADKALLLAQKYFDNLP